MRLKVPIENGDLLNWAHTNNKLLDGRLEFISPLAGQPAKKLFFKKARCVRYEELFVLGDEQMGSYTCRLEIAAQEITNSSGSSTNQTLATSSSSGSTSGRLPATESGASVLAVPPARTAQTTESIDQPTAEGVEQANKDYNNHIARLGAARKKLSEDSNNSEKETLEKAITRADESYWDLQLAKLSEHVYSVDKKDEVGNLSVPPPTGWTMVSEAQLEGKSLPPERMINPKTGFKSAVYQPHFGPEPRKPVLAFAGTDDIHDVLTDVKQAVGLRDKQYKNAAENARIVSQWLGSDGFEATGHSMGGGLASMSTAVTGAQATTINAAGLHPRTAKRADVSREQMAAEAEKIRAVHSTQDGLTNTQSVGKKLRLLPDALGKPIPVTPHPDIQHKVTELVTLNPMKGIKAAKTAVLDGHGKAQLVKSLSYQMDQDVTTIDTYLGSARPS